MVHLSEKMASVFWGTYHKIIDSVMNTYSYFLQTVALLFGVLETMWMVGPSCAVTERMSVDPN